MMKLSWLPFLCFLQYVKYAVSSESPVWPSPKLDSSDYSIKSLLYLDETFHFSVIRKSWANPNESNIKGLSIVEKAVVRYENIISPPPASVGLIKSCSINIDDFSVSDSIVLDCEAYSLTIDESGRCSITSKTPWGALRAMETFTHLLNRESLPDGRTVIGLQYASIDIKDDSRFMHRGILIDTSRHYFPLQTIKSLIDAMPMNKLNVLHWHAVDAESFPLNTPSMPTMIEGAFTDELVYSMEDIAALTSYAYDRGVQVILEVDVPGHAASWAAGKPQLMADCLVKYSYNINDYALNPTLPETYETIGAIIKDLVASSRSAMIHLGGDEVVYGCWREDQGITQYMAENGIANYNQLLSMFVLKVDDIMASIIPSSHQTTIHWDEVFTASVASGMPCNASNTVFQVWTDASKIQTVTAAKYRVIASPSSYWYLNSAISWQVMYAYDPTVGLSDAQSELVIGGETALWTDFVDEANLLTTIFPRAAAVAERLWSPASAVDSADAERRLLVQHCRMRARGIASSPVKAGFCDNRYV